MLFTHHIQALHGGNSENCNTGTTSQRELPETECGYGMKKYCEHFTGLLVNERDDEILLAMTRCGKWTCDFCGVVNSRMWYARILEHLNQNSDLDWCWFTLTAHSKKRGAVKSIENLRSAWDTLTKRMKRKFGKYQYCRVYEKHRDGSFHIHCIASFHFNDIKVRHQKNGTDVNYSMWLSKTAKSLKLGYYTHADDISTTKHAGFIASYVAKYITKMSVDFASEIGRVRRIQTSQNWAKLEKPKNGEWKLRPGFYEADIFAAIKKRKHVIDVSLGYEVTIDDFEETYIYPPKFAHDY